MKNILKKYYGKKSAKEIAEITGYTVQKIYNLAQKYNISSNKKQNKQYYISDEAEQIILGGILGDGNIRRIGNGAVYREKHAFKEKEYCLWKREKLKGFCNLEKDLYTYKDKYVSFDSFNTSQLLKYKNMSYKEVVENITELGVLSYLFDDGWVKVFKSHKTMLVESRLIPKDVMELLSVKISNMFDTKVTFHSREYKGKILSTISIVGVNSIIPYCEKFCLNVLDVYRNKILK